jgi:hypothetical protein
MRKQSDEDLRDDAATDWTEAVARLPHVCFAEQVVPQWCLATPSSFGRADFVFCQRSLADAGAICSPDGSPTPSPRSRSRTASEWSSSI